MATAKAFIVETSYITHTLHPSCYLTCKTFYTGSGDYYIPPFLSKGNRDSKWSYGLLMITRDAFELWCWRRLLSLRVSLLPSPSSTAPCPRRRSPSLQSGPLGAEAAAARAASAASPNPDTHCLPLHPALYLPHNHGARSREELSSRGALRGAGGAWRCGRARQG